MGQSPMHCAAAWAELGSASGATQVNPFECVPSALNQEVSCRFASVSDILDFVDAI